MKLIFLGTKGEIEESSKKHKYHSSLLIKYKKFKLLIDHGIISEDLKKIKPDAILITHAHPDHYIWTKKDYETDILVYLTKETLNYGKFKPKNFKVIKPRKKFTVGHLKIFGYKVIHSIKCPAIGFRINNIIYNPDLIDIINKNKILKNINYYIGDGSCFKANLIRKKNNKLFGHARIITQINWCKKFNIKNIIFTHFGKEIIENEQKIKQKIPKAIFAYDNMKINIKN